MLTQDELTVPSLGPCRVSSPLALREGPRRFVADGARVLYHVEYGADDALDPLSFEKAGPRETIYFEPRESCAAIVTCGGLCPGLNNVIRNLYYTLHGDYGVRRVLGIRNGYRGLNPAEGLPPIELTGASVEHVHHRGGTILGTSRGPHDPEAAVDFLQSNRVNMLLAIGGDGTQRGAHAIALEAAARGAPIAVVGVPKTIDNDIKFCYQSFGFVSAVAEAERVIDRAHVESKSVHRGVGLVKLMGREAGFIAAAATIASGEVNFALVPEVPFTLSGPNNFLEKLARRLDARGHAVIVVAEGAGQDLFEAAPDARDSSGNRKLGDVGALLKSRVIEHFHAIDRPVDVKYFDPSYYIRSAHADAADSVLCEQFARGASHAAMAGKTDMLVGLWNGRTVHVPLAVSTGQVKRLEPTREMWATVLAITDQDQW